MSGRTTVSISRPLICYPLEALAAVLTEVAIIAKADTPLPSFHTPHRFGQAVFSAKVSPFDGVKKE